MRRLLPAATLFAALLIPVSAEAVTTSSASISTLNPACSGISVTATGSNTTGIRETDFVLIDTTKDAYHNYVDSKYFAYSPPLPKTVTESWSSRVALAPGVPYAVAFHVWDRLGNLVAYDRKDFTCA